MNDKTKDILTAIPFEQEFKDNILASFDSMTIDQKAMIVEIIWTTFAALYKIQLDENLRLALERAKQGKEPLDSDFYKRVHEQTDKDMLDTTVETVETADLTEAREAMERIIKEMKAAKMPLKVD